MAGVVVVVLPGISLFTLTIVLGVWLVVLGAIAVVRALQARSTLRAVGSGPVPA